MNSEEGRVEQLSENLTKFRALIDQELAGVSSQVQTFERRFKRNIHFDDDLWSEVFVQFVESLSSRPIDDIREIMASTSTEEKLEAIRYSIQGAAEHKVELEMQLRNSIEENKALRSMLQKEEEQSKMVIQQMEQSHAADAKCWEANAKCFKEEVGVAHKRIQMLEKRLMLVQKVVTKAGVKNEDWHGTNIDLTDDTE